MSARIGITTSLEEDADDGDRQTLRLAYVRAVERAGGLPVLVPMLEQEAATHAFADALDGLVVTGGPAVTEGLVGDGGDGGDGASPTLPDDLPGNTFTRRRSDGWLLDAFEDDAGGFWKPVLGICYGMQLVNARRGGRLWADVERQVPGAGTHSQKRGGQTHALSLHAGTHLHRLFHSATPPDDPEAAGNGPLRVNTRHVQALASAGRGLRVSATAPDGVIEAIESVDGAFLGVQFHPERLGEPFMPLFRHLVERAERGRTALRGAQRG